MKILITGITGFVGSHLAEYALSQGAEVSGSVRWRSKTDNIETIKKNINLIECDLSDSSSVTALVAKSKPDYIFHLGAQSFVPTSWHAPAETLTSNILGELNIFEALRNLERNAKIQIAGSSEEYGKVLPSELPIKETNPLRPLSPYGVSKIAQDFLGYQYHQSYGLEVIRTRAFNHTGPRRGEVFVTSNFAKQIAAIEKGLQEPVISVGNLEAARDFTDVRDIVRAYWLTLEKCTPGEVYNICSGKTFKIKEMLEILLSFSNIKIQIQSDKKRMRPSDVPMLLGDYSKFHAQTGWKPEIPFERTLEDLLNYWRKCLNP